MHPLLAVIPLPAWRFPLTGVLLTCAVLGVAVAAVGLWQRARELVFVGTVASAACVGMAGHMWGQPFSVSSLPLHGYGSALALSFLAGWFLSARLAERGGIPGRRFAGAYFATLIGALLGARLLYVVTNLSDFDDAVVALDLQGGGLAAYGGFVGGLLGAWLYARSAGVSLRLWADCAAPSAALGVGLTRIGCYLHGCDFGKPLGSQAPLWLRKVGTFPRWDEPSLPLGTGAPAWQLHVERGWIEFDATTSLPVHPTQLYESLAGLMIFAAALWVWHKRRFAGQVMLTVAMAYGACRFALELWRGDPERGQFGLALGPATTLGIALFVLGASAAAGPLHCHLRARLRRLAQGLALVPALVGPQVLAGVVPGGAVSVPLSSSQWIALLTIAAAGISWRRLCAAGRRDATPSLSSPGEPRQSSLCTETASGRPE